MPEGLTRLRTGPGTGRAGVLRALVSLYSSWTTLLVNGVFFVAYYAVFYELITRSNSGYFLLTVPLSLLVGFVLASSVLATVAVLYLRLSLRRRALPGIVESPVGVAVGTFVVSCSCNLPLIAPLMYFLGLNSIEVSGVESFLAAYQQSIVGLIILLDIVSIYYYLRQISRSGFAQLRP
jgi:hypothetical protein